MSVGDFFPTPSITDEAVSAQVTILRRYQPLWDWTNGNILRDVFRASTEEIAMPYVVSRAAMEKEQKTAGKNSRIDFGIETTIWCELPRTEEVGDSTIATVISEIKGFLLKSAGASWADDLAASNYHLKLGASSPALAQHLIGFDSVDYLLSPSDAEAMVLVASFITHYQISINSIDRTLMASNA